MAGVKRMTIYKYIGGQDCGKTSLMVKAAIYDHYVLKYNHPGEQFGNLHLDLKHYTYLPSEGIIELMAVMLRRKWLHKCLYIDEADRVLSPYWWFKEEQQDAVLGSWQDIKMYNIIRYTTHFGDVNIMLRRATQRVVLPHFFKDYDATLAKLIRPHDRWYTHRIMYKISQSFNVYDRWEVIV
jgi:hypothetical protein